MGQEVDKQTMKARDSKRGRTRAPHVPAEHVNMPTISTVIHTINKQIQLRLMFEIRADHRADSALRCKLWSRLA